MEEGAEHLHDLQTLKFSAFVFASSELLKLSKYTQVNVQTVAYSFLVSLLQLNIIFLPIIQLFFFLFFKRFIYY